MFYTVYKITNKKNNKYYIGMHQTNNLDDGYMGSGKRLKSAIKKYGLENFTKEILVIFDNEKDMKNKEKELVVLNEMSYNLCEGGKGGFGYINSLPNSKELKKIANKKFREKHPEILKKNAESLNLRKKKEASIEIKRKKTLMERYGSCGVKSFLGKNHTTDTKNKMSLAAKLRLKDPKNNSQFGTMWINDGNNNKKIKKEEINFWIDKGYFRGRLIARQ